MAEEKLIFTQLDCVSTEDLIEILLNRHDHAVFAYYKEDEDYYAYVKGDAVMCKGLASEIVSKVDEEVEDDEDELQ